MVVAAASTTQTENENIMFIRILLIAVFLLFSANSFAQTQGEYDTAVKNWAYVLENYVDEEGRTDFKRLSNQLSELQQVVDFIASTSPRTHPDLFPTADAVLAYHINTYNALAMYGVINKGIPKGFTSLFSRAAFFKFRRVVIGNKKTNLYDYENKVIRPLGDARSHFALNCMVKDCPRLPQTPFTEQGLNEQLDKVAWEFFSKPKHFYLNADKKIAFVSAILKFYTKDFVKSGKTKHLAQYINNYLNEPVPSDYKIKYIDYDWRINKQP